LNWCTAKVCSSATQQRLLSLATIFFVGAAQYKCDSIPVPFMRNALDGNGHLRGIRESVCRSLRKLYFPGFSAAACP
jgi:hypothetical protein